jgi:hypothetical protein
MPEETNIPYLSFSVCHGLVSYPVDTVLDFRFSPLCR